MVRQHDHRIDCERMMPARLAKRSTQLVDVLRQQAQSPLPRLTVKKKLPPAMKLRR
jgi:hypothetical protein